MLPEILDLDTLRRAYAGGALTPLEVAEEIIARMAASPDPAVFIAKSDPDALRAAALALMDSHPEPNSLPLWGIPFAVKDNIDVAGFPTTAACPEFSYTPKADAVTVARLKAAGALVVGKTNLDQFATGLNGTRSPYGAPRSVFDFAYISGGSSSGSAVAVASGLASFALGTDTAGSGRVPAMMNNLVGIKPTPGLVPNTGVVPACKSLDCVTVFAANVADGVAVRRVMEGFDAGDPYSRSARQAGLPGAPRIGILRPDQREFFGNEGFAERYENALKVALRTGCELIEVDYTPFEAVARLLYEGPWVAERLAAIEDFFADHSEAIEPTVRAIIGGAEGRTAVDAFKAQYRLGELRQALKPVWEGIDLLLPPTAPTTYTVEEMLADPVRLNSRLGLYTNFVNLLGYSAIAVPAGFSGHLPFGVTLVAPGFCDDALAPLADALHRALGEGMGRDRAAPLPATKPAPPADDAITVAVVGAHLSGMPLNPDLLALGARFVERNSTAPGYRMYVLPNSVPPKPGLVRDPDFVGGGIAVELYALPPDGFGRFVASIPAPLGIGKITLADGREVCGFLCEACGVRGAREITSLGGWRAYIKGPRSA